MFHTQAKGMCVAGVGGVGFYLHMASKDKVRKQAKRKIAKVKEKKSGKERQERLKNVEN